MRARGDPYTGMKTRLATMSLSRDGFAIQLTEVIPELRKSAQYDNIYVSNDAAGIEKAQQIAKHGTGVI
jgi:hypothetical protein